MSLLIHATLTVTGDRESLAACDARIKALLVAEAYTGEFGEHHGDDALSYDFKVHGGIPFPAFAAASQEFPGLTITAEWVNVAAGRKGQAQIANGAITDHREEAVALAAGDTRNRHLLADPDGTLRIAVALMATAPGRWAGYVLDHERDALFDIARDGDAIELLATDGAPDWVLRWRLAGEDSAPAPEVIAPQRIDPAQYAALEQFAQAFVADWIWFRDAPAESNAIDVDRFARYGYTVHDANVRAARLHALRNEAGEGRPLLHDTVDPECRWIVGVLLRCWAG
ncbi:MAG: hypothetical protein ACO3F9_10955 [Burkholderiales bacterium]